MAFFVVGWYAHRRSQQELYQFIDEELPTEEVDNGFSDVFEQQFNQPLTNEIVQDKSIDSEPTVSLSSAVAEQQSELMNSTKDETEIEIDSEQANIRDWDMVVAFTIMTSEANQFTGKAIKAALESVDMHFGELQTYHRYTVGIQKQSLFSVANILDPGTLSPESLATMTTPGLLIFARLPGPINGLALFDDLLETAEKLAIKLSGTLCDEKREPISQHSLEQMRGRILTLNLTIQAETSQYPNDYSE